MRRFFYAHKPGLISHRDFHHNDTTITTARNAGVLLTGKMPVPQIGIQTYEPREEIPGLSEQPEKPFYILRLTLRHSSGRGT